MSTTYRRIVLAARPEGWVQAQNFRLETVPLTQPQDGQLLVRVHYLSLDPYMRGRIGGHRSYADPQPLDEVMIGGAAGEVVASHHPDFPVGAKVVGMLGWQEYALSNGEGLMIVDDSQVPLSAHLGPAGMPGMTAWYGYHQILKPKPGETLVVSAASGAVGSVVGQLARLHGVRAVGIAGGPDKCRYVVETLGFDACIDYRQADSVKALYAMLRDETPNGVDAYFENVGGDVLQAVLARLNPHSRIALCGLISDYNNNPGDTPRSMINPAQLLISRVTLRGFIVSEHMEFWPQGLQDLREHIIDGRLQYRESIAEGLEAAPEAFIGMLKGKNFGKQLVKLV